MVKSEKLAKCYILQLFQSVINFIMRKAGLNILLSLPPLK